jgi:hypothetical protein
VLVGCADFVGLTHPIEDVSPPRENFFKVSPGKAIALAARTETAGSAPHR